MIYFTGTLYWITGVMVMYGNLAGWVGVAINALLVLYLSLYPALFAVIVWRARAAHGALAIALSPCVWVATELGRTDIFGGFPWVLLGYSQTSVLPIAQLASLVGVYGVSLIVASTSAAVVVAFDRRLVSRSRRFAPSAVVIAALVVAAAWGSRRLGRSELTREGSPVRVGLIQGNVDQAIKWDPARASEIFADYIRKTRQAISEGASLVIWPESSTPFMFEEDRAGADVVRALARQARVPILFGSDQVEWRVAGNQRTPDKYYNAAFLVGADGSTKGIYRKLHLVPFGEYIPFQKLLFFAAPLTEQVGSFTPGDAATLLPVAGHPISVAICYEVVYAPLVRRFVAGGSELLTTMTNDAWFGDTSAPDQHFEQASMRAIENARYLVRAANTGVSGIVDPYGRVLHRTPVYQPAVVVGDARFLTSTTLYTRIGDVAAYASVIATLALLTLRRRRVQ